MDQEQLIWAVRPLVDIVEHMAEQQQVWYQKTMAATGMMVTEVHLPPASFILFYALMRAHGPMAAGNWLRLPLRYCMNAELGEDEIGLSNGNAFAPMGVMSGVGYHVPALGDENALLNVLKSKRLAV